MGGGGGYIIKAGLALFRIEANKAHKELRRAQRCRHCWTATGPLFATLVETRGRRIWKAPCSWVSQVARRKIETLISSGFAARTPQLSLLPKSSLRSAGADPTDYLVKLAKDFEYEDGRCWDLTPKLDPSKPQVACRSACTSFRWAKDRVRRRFSVRELGTSRGKEELLRRVTASSDIPVFCCIFCARLRL